MKVESEHRIPIERKDNTEVKDAMIYQNNKIKNQERTLFFNFLINNTKIEAHLEELQSYLFWVGIVEYFAWIVLLALFISSPSNMGIIWIFFYHNARATIGLFILRHIPKTHHVIENLKDYENNSLEDISKAMEHNYITLLHDSERVLKPLLITYLSLTVASVIIDLIVFCVIASRISDSEHAQKVFISLLAIGAFLICDFVYFTFLGSLRFSFPPETLMAIRRAIFGFFTQLKIGIASGFKGVVNRITRRTVSQAAQNL